MFRNNRSAVRLCKKKHTNKRDGGKVCRDRHVSDSLIMNLSRRYKLKPLWHHGDIPPPNSRAVSRRTCVPAVSLRRCCPQAEPSGAWREGPAWCHRVHWRLRWAYLLTDDLHLTWQIPRRTPSTSRSNGRVWSHRGDFTVRRTLHSTSRSSHRRTWRCGQSRLWKRWGFYSSARFP